MNIVNENISYCLCICTYRRIELLRLLLMDIMQQTCQPGMIIIVDGEPDSSSVKKMLYQLFSTVPFPIHYLPSNHANLSYQRYLGWRAASSMSLSTQLILYLDDDLRITQKDAIHKLMHAFQEQEVVGATANIIMGDKDKLIGAPMLVEDLQVPKVFRSYFSSNGLRPGSLSPTGNRISPVARGEPIARTEWLRGGVMAYRLNSLRNDTFSEDLFSLDEIHCGKGEDTILSRRASLQGGKLVLVFDSTFEHPHADFPKTYPVSAYHLGYATAYSRRLLNDHYRVTRPPYFQDRFNLLKSYLGMMILSWGKAFLFPKRYRFTYAVGYSLGAVRGIFVKPTTRRLTPHIDWQADAQAALENLELIQQP